MFLGDPQPDNTMPWDPAKPFTDRQYFNQGCAPEYFAQFVSGYETHATEYSPGKFVRCRLLATSSADTIQKESAVSVRENVNAFGQGVEDTLKQGAQKLQALAELPWGWILVGVGGLWALTMIKR